jgi:hypothetical protein
VLSGAVVVPCAAQTHLGTHCVEVTSGVPAREGSMKPFAPLLVCGLLLVKGCAACDCWVLGSTHSVPRSICFIVQRCSIVYELLIVVFHDGVISTCRHMQPCQVVVSNSEALVLPWQRMPSYTRAAPGLWLTSVIAQMSRQHNACA